MRSLLFHPITVVVITILAMLYFFSLRTTLQQAERPSKTVSELKQEVTDLASEVSSLEEKAELAQTEFAREKMIRDELLMQKPGEYVIQLSDKIDVTLPASLPSPTPTPWEEWKKLLF